MARQKCAQIERKSTDVEFLAQIIDARENDKLSAREIVKKVKISRSTVLRTIIKYKAKERGRDGQIVG